MVYEQSVLSPLGFPTRIYFYIGLVSESVTKDNSKVSFRMYIRN